jgi:hypothetical protein
MPSSIPRTRLHRPGYRQFIGATTELPELDGGGDHVLEVDSAHSPQIASSIIGCRSLANGTGSDGYGREAVRVTRIASELDPRQQSRPERAPASFPAIQRPLVNIKVPQLQARRGAGATGLEPATSGVTGRRSNQLSYAPERTRMGRETVARGRKLADSGVGPGGSVRRRGRARDGPARGRLGGPRRRRSLPGFRAGRLFGRGRSVRSSALRPWRRGRSRGAGLPRRVR